MKVLPEPQSS